MSKETPEKHAPLKELKLDELKAKIQAKKDGELVELPSGLVLPLKKPSIARLLKADAFPQGLVAVAIKMDSNTNDPQTREEYLKSLDVINTIVSHAVVRPKVVLNEDEVTEDSILVDDLEDNDRVAIYLYCQTGVKPLQSFRS